jgi:hypothetical protein
MKILQMPVFWSHAGIKANHEGQPTTQKLYNVALPVQISIWIDPLRSPLNSDRRTDDPKTSTLNVILTKSE